MKYFILFAMAFVQTVSGTMVMRSKVVDSMVYSIAAQIVSSGVWFLTFRSMILQNMALDLCVPYAMGTLLGAALGVKISIWFERMIGFLK